MRLDDAQSDKSYIFGRFSFGKLNFGNSPLYGAGNPYDAYYYVNTTNTRNVFVGG